MQIRLLGRIWRLIRVKKLTRGQGGECDAPTTPRKAIRILEGLSEEDELRLLIHEFLHACNWWADEEWVDEVSSDMANALWRLGWRKTKPK